jgi:hypothetical protein
MRKNWFECNCPTCDAVTNSRFTHTFNLKEFSYDNAPLNCDYCKEKRRNEMCGELPPILLNFLNVNNLCTFCRNGFCYSVMKVYGLCWAKASNEAICIALLWHLKRDLSSKICVLSMIKNGSWGRERIFPKRIK